MKGSLWRRRHLGFHALLRLVSTASLKVPSISSDQAVANSRWLLPQPAGAA